MHEFPISYSHTEWYFHFSDNEMVEVSPVKTNYNKNNNVSLRPNYRSLRSAVPCHAALKNSLMSVDVVWL